MAELSIRDQAYSDLCQWGLWNRLHKLNGFYSAQPYYQPPKGFREDGTPLDLEGNCLVIDDDFATRVDRSVGKLKQLDPRYVEIAHLKFMGHLNSRSIASMVRINKDKVTSIVGEVVSVVASDIYIQNAA